MIEVVGIMICLFALITIWYGTPRHTVTVLQGQTPLQSLQSVL